MISYTIVRVYGALDRYHIEIGDTWVKGTITKIGARLWVFRERRQQLKKTKNQRKYPYWPIVWEKTYEDKIYRDGELIDA